MGPYAGAGRGPADETEWHLLVMSVIIVMVVIIIIQAEKYTMNAAKFPIKLRMP